LAKPLYSESLAAAKQLDSDPAAKIRVLEKAVAELERLGETRKANKLKRLIKRAKEKLAP